MTPQLTAPRADCSGQQMYDAGQEPRGGSGDLDGTSGENSQGGAAFKPVL